MTNGQTINQVLEHINLERWGYRKAELVRLVATLQEGPNPVPLGRQMLMAMGRSNRQARYDHELLLRLADDRVLIRWRGQGRRPDSWAVAPVEGWRQIRWTTPRRDVIRAFSSPLPGAAVALWTKTAGQPSRSGPIGGQSGGVAVSDSRSDHWSTTQRPLDPTQRATGESPVDMVHNATADDAPSPCLLKSEFTPSLPPQSEGVSVDRPIGGEGGKLLTAVRRAVQTDVFGSPAARIVAVAEAHPVLVPALVAFAAGMGWVKTATAAAGLIEAQADTLAHPTSATPADALLRSLRQQIANLEAFNPEDERLPAMRTELGQLEGSQPVVAGQA